jgi:hypothetical protein
VKRRIEKPSVELNGPYPIDSVLQDTMGERRIK